MTFKEFTDLWAKNYGEKELAPKTYERYKGMLKSRIIPYFGHYKLCNIKPTHIMNFYDYLSKDHQLKRCKNHNGKTVMKVSDRTKSVLKTSMLILYNIDIAQRLISAFTFNFLICTLKI